MGRSIWPHSNSPEIQKKNPNPKQINKAGGIKEPSPHDLQWRKITSHVINALVKITSVLLLFTEVTAAQNLLPHCSEIMTSDTHRLIVNWPLFSSFDMVLAKKKTVERHLYLMSLFLLKGTFCTVSSPCFKAFKMFFLITVLLLGSKQIQLKWDLSI